MAPIKLQKTSIIKYSRIICNLPADEIVTEDHVEKMKYIINKHIDENKSPSEIAEIYNIKHSNFSAFLRSIGIKLKSVKESINISNIKRGRIVTDEKTKFFNECSFKFDPYSYPEIPGYELLIQHGIYNSTTNKNGVCRDHILSKKHAYEQKIDPSLISHIANCQFLTNSDNVRKSESSWISLSELQDAINQNKFPKIDRKAIKTRGNLSSEHRRKLSELNAKYMFITNGEINIRLLKTSEIPNGFRRGFIRKKVSAIGLEPTSLRDEA